MSACGEPFRVCGPAAASSLVKGVEVKRSVLTDRYAAYPILLALV